jgi:MFS family permease
MLGSYILITALSGSFAEQGSKAVGVAVSNPSRICLDDSLSPCSLPELQVVPFLFIFFGGYSIAFTPITTAYWTEVWPFALRARGVALGSMTIYSALLFNLFVNPIALAAIAWKYYIVFICVLIIAMITIYFTYPETRGFTLEEMVIVFDGSDQHVSESSDGMEKAQVNEVTSSLYAHEENVLS